MPEHKHLGVKPVTPEFLPPETKLDSEFDSLSGLDNVAGYIQRTVLETLPNDLTRMVYLASLRDCNSGMYLHPELSRQWGVEAADRGLRCCHEAVFRTLLTTKLPEYVIQLHEYIRYTRSEIFTVLKTWKSLQAYRATVPVGAFATSAELYFINVAIALEIVGQETPESVLP
jgi:hypothetical protein